jgi:hypothetical protein
LAVVEVLQRKGPLANDDLLDEVKDNYGELSFRELNSALLKLELNGVLRVTPLMKGKRRVKLVGIKSMRRLGIQLPEKIIKNLSKLRSVSKLLRCAISAIARRSGSRPENMRGGFRSVLWRAIDRIFFKTDLAAPIFCHTRPSYQSPAMIIIRPSLSKARQQYFAFLTGYRSLHWLWRGQWRIAMGTESLP